MSETAAALSVGAILVKQIADSLLQLIEAAPGNIAKLNEANALISQLQSEDQENAEGVGALIESFRSVAIAAQAAIPSSVPVDPEPTPVFETEPTAEVTEPALY